MVCSYCYSCINLAVALVDFQVEGCVSRLRQVWQGGYVAMHVIELDGAERKIIHDFFDELWMGGKSDKSKKVGHTTVYRVDKLEEVKEEVEGTVLGD